MKDCIYTKSIKQKTKKWLDGYFIHTNGNLTLYNTDKKKICNFRIKYLENEIKTSMYLIYIDNIDQSHSDKNSENKDLPDNTEEDSKNTHFKYRNSENKDLCDNTEKDSKNTQFKYRNSENKDLKSEIEKKKEEENFRKPRSNNEIINLIKK